MPPTASAPVIHLRRDDLPLPVQTLPPVAQVQPPHHRHHPLHRVLGTEQLLLRDAPPERPAKVRAHRARVVGQRHRLVAAPRRQHDVQAAGDAVHRGLARPVRVPPAGPVVRDGAHPRRHHDPRRVPRQRSRPAAHVGGPPRQQLGKVLRQEQRADRVDAEHVQAAGRVDLREGPLGRQDPGHRAPQVQVVRVRREQAARGGGGGADGRLVGGVDAHDVQPGGRGAVAQDGRLGRREVRVARRGEHGERRRPEQVPREMEADAAAGGAHEDPRAGGHLSLLPWLLLGGGGFVVGGFCRQEQARRQWMADSGWPTVDGRQWTADSGRTPGWNFSGTWMPLTYVIDLETCRLVI
ncbi:hypothetical protein UVI_02032900 [Ustilaginoidea virens]|uniref:Uncharacterized protein n=1 Tax=Ustilaginoidea virens TaxID=1159556 RepID=A0A1B5L483_USTVR|nr:hypothetical protein UVI_02032900 [Ustilaginoidea virens]